MRRIAAMDRSDGACGLTNEAGLRAGRVRCGRWFLTALACWVTLAALAAAPPSLSGFRSEKLGEIDAAVTNAIGQGNLPGGVLWLERNGQIYAHAYGFRSLEPEKELMTPDTIFDAASLTKVIATAPAVMLLLERGQLDLDDPVQKHLPAFRGEGTGEVTIRHLLTHTSGLRPGLGLTPAWKGYQGAIDLAGLEKAQKPPGTAFVYSDINFILLGEIVRQVSGQTLDAFTAAEIYQPLGMVDTGFLPPVHQQPRIAPTEKVAEGMLRGVVHDPTARRMGGVAGHAGLFTAAQDLARFARMLLNEGELDGVRIFKPETVRLMTSAQSPLAVSARRGLGWDIDSPYSGPRGDLFPKGSYGHTGWTGTSLWIDPLSRTFVIFLSNRNHPNGQGTVVQLRKQLGTLAAQAIVGFEFAQTLEPSFKGRPLPLAKPKVLNGIDVLVKRDFAPLRKRRIGLITNHTGQDHQRRPTVDLLHKAPEVELKVLFSPEHGLRGQMDAAVPDSVDEKTGLMVYSLYGERKVPSREQLKDLDALVFDVQDIGCRFYTYISTMGLCMEAAAQAGLKFIVLDRVNPINGLTVEGPVYRGASSFVAFHALALRHGMTIGELARMFRAERNLRLDLEVIPLESWKREMWFDETGLPWVSPSPNMRNLKEAILYPGVGLLERVLSVGRGTDTPFEMMGAPYLHDVFLAEQLHALELPGVRFVPVQFTPAASTFAGQACGGVYVLLTDREKCPVVDIGLGAAVVVRRYFGEEFDLENLNALLLDPRLVEAIKAGRTLAEIKQAWAEDLASFRTRREAFLLYP
jgi:uncharacterized protein YbbC (DUF1343 family)/CubicO group peptidase (beta-lactamase class C family)